MDYSPRLSISPRSFYTMFVINCINVVLTILICIFIIDWSNFFYFLTVWTYFLNTIYLISIWITDINLFFFKSFALEKHSFFLREKIGPVLNGLSHMVVLSFWTLLAMGPEYMQMETTVKEILANMHLHGALSVIAIVDVMVNRHLKKHFEWKLLIFLLIIYAMYCTVITVSIFTGGFIPYPFLNDIPIWLLIVYCAVLFGVLVVGYVLHLGIIRLKFVLCSNASDGALIDVTPVVANEKLVHEDNVM